jgi:hypothetical protein
MANPNYLVYIQEYSTPGSTTPAVSIVAPIPESVLWDSTATYEMPLPQGPEKGPLASVAQVLGMKLSVQMLTAKLWAGSAIGSLSIPLEFVTESDPVADVRDPIVNLMKLVTPSTSNSLGLLQSPGPQLDLSLFTQLAKDAASQITNTFSNTPSGVGQQSQYSSGSILNGFGGLANPNLTNINLTQSTMMNSSTQTADGTNSTVFKSPTQNPSIGTAAYWKSQVSKRISIKIGNYLFFDNVIVTHVGQEFASTFDAVTGLPHHVRVSLTFEPMFMLTQEDLDNVYLSPGNNGTTSGNNTYGFSIPDTSLDFGG